MLREDGVRRRENVACEGVRMLRWRGDDGEMARRSRPHLDEARGELPLEMVLVRPPMLIAAHGGRGGASGRE